MMEECIALQRCGVEWMMHCSGLVLSLIYDCAAIKNLDCCANNKYYLLTWCVPCRMMCVCVCVSESDRTWCLCYTASTDEWQTTRECEQMAAWRPAHLHGLWGNKHFTLHLCHHYHHHESSNQSRSRSWYTRVSIVYIPLPLPPVHAVDDYCFKGLQLGRLSQRV